MSLINEIINNAGVTEIVEANKAGTFHAEFTDEWDKDRKEIVYYVDLAIDGKKSRFKLDEIENKMPEKQLAAFKKAVGAKANRDLSSTSAFKKYVKDNFKFGNHTTDFVMNTTEDGASKKITRLALDNKEIEDASSGRTTSAEKKKAEHEKSNGKKDGIRNTANEVKNARKNGLPAEARKKIQDEASERVASQKQKKEKNAAKVISKKANSKVSSKYNSKGRYSEGHI